MYNAITCRKRIGRVAPVNPAPLRTYELKEDEHGNRNLVEVEPVAFSMASDFSIDEVALSGGALASQVRFSSDLVDLETRINKTL